MIPRFPYTLEVETLTGERRSLDDFRGKVLLVVNTASKCGLTPQYEGLETLWQRYRDQGLVVLGFPCNQFAGQEPGDAAAIGEFCQINYGVSFPMFAKIEVNGPNTHPLFEALKEAQPGLFGSRRIKWNFTKFLVDRDGNIVDRFAPKDRPEAMEGMIKRLLERPVGQTAA